MPLIAHWGKTIVFASQAHPSLVYSCPACQSPMKLRKGKYLVHFYHTRTCFSCHFKRKSEKHLLFQEEIAKILKLPYSCMETPFPQIGRIADLYWPEKKIVFEIQCSSILSQEILKRQTDYSSLGLKVVWVLEASRFDRTTKKKNAPMAPFFFAQWEQGQKKCFFYERKKGKKSFLWLQNLPHFLEVSEDSSKTKTTLKSFFKKRELKERLIKKIKDSLLFLFQRL